VPSSVIIDCKNSSPNSFFLRAIFLDGLSFQITKALGASTFLFDSSISWSTRCGTTEFQRQGFCYATSASVTKVTVDLGPTSNFLLQKPFLPEINSCSINPSSIPSAHFRISFFRGLCSNRPWAAYFQLKWFIPSFIRKSTWSREASVKFLWELFSAVSYFFSFWSISFWKFEPTCPLAIH